MFGIRYPYSIGIAALIGLAIGLAIPALADATSVQFVYNSGVATLLCVLASTLAATIAFMLYQGSGQLLPSYIRIPLGIFRYLVLLLVGLMFLEPRLETSRKQSQPPVIAILHDDSESMVIHKDSTFIKNEYRASLKRFLDKLNTGQASTQFFSFGGGVRAAQAPDSLRFVQPGTNLSGALEEVANRFSNQNLGAVVLLSDGIPTAGSNPIYTLEQFQQPIYTVLVGDTTPQRDIRIAEVLYNEIAYLDNETPIKVKLNSSGFEQANLKVTLSGGGKVIATQNVSLSRSQPGGEVDFLVRPDRTGLQQYNIAVEPLAGELTTRNNYRSIYIKVLETRVRIGLFAGFPHPDIGAIREALQRDGRYELSEHIHNRPTTFYEEPLAAELSKFDLLILHNFPLSPADASWMEKIKAEVEGRKLPFISIVGQSTHLQTLQNTLGSHLALYPGVIQTNSEEAQMTFKPEYKEHSTFTFDDAWLRLMSSAPPLVRNQSDWRAAGDAKVYATARIKTIVVDYPVYGLRNHLERKNMVLVGENIWRVRQHVRVESGDYEAFDAWLYNNIQWLMVREDKRRFKVSPSKTLYSAAEQVLFRGEAYDESYRPLPGVDVKLTLRRPNGKEDVLYLNEAGNARYFLELNNMEEGNYTFTAEGRKNDVKIGSDRGEFSIGKSNIEHFHLTADQAMMQQLALRSGGTFHTARQLDGLADEILQLKSLKPVVSYITKRIGFNEFQWIFYILLGLLAVEWIVRKRFSLS